MRADITPQHHEIVVNGLRLHYLAWGDPKNPPMVMLHGFAQQAHSFDFVAMDLGQDHYVISLDQRGHGDSDWAPNGEYGAEYYVKDLEEVVEKLQLKPFILIGLSMGGGNAIRYTAEHLDKVRGLVIVDITPQPREEGSRAIRNFVAMEDELDSFDDFVERAAKYNPLRDPESFRGSMQHNLKQLPNGKWTWKYDKWFRQPREESTDRPRFDLWPSINKLKLPVLVVRGEKSNVVAEENARAMVDALPDVQYTVVPNAGHLVPGDQPDLFSDAVRHWLETRRPEG